MLPCAAYLRIYEPLSAFAADERARWSNYAASSDRPRRAHALAQEYADELRRLSARPPVIVPARESGDAYVRWADGVTYICPWQTRLRSWLALRTLRSTAAAPLSDAFAPRQAAAAAENFAKWESRGGSARVYIQTSGWSVPLPWFVPFAPAERWLVLGTPSRPGASPDGPPAAPGAAGPAGAPGAKGATGAAGAAGTAGAADVGAAEVSKGPATASATRMLVYATAMSQARRRVARCLATTRRVSVRGLEEAAQVAAALVQIGDDLEEIGRWLEEFHPHSLVELDYGGLVQLMDDDTLRGDQSVAEVAAACSALSGGELELATAMYQRLRTRWRALEEIESGS
jgi:hypothetical protein